LDKHQGEATTSQLGWHLAEPPSYAANLRENFIKKKGKRVQEGGLDQNLKKNKKEKEEIKTENKNKETTREPRAREPTPVQEEVSLKILRQHREPNCALY